MNKYMKGVVRYTFAKITPYDEKVPEKQSSLVYISYVLHEIVPIQCRT